MTLIASFGVQGCPIVFGDLLLTGPTELGEGKIVSAPASGELQNFFGDSGWSVSGLHQKVNVISDRCAIAWADSFIGGRLAIRELRRRFQRGDVSFAELTAFLENDPDLQSLGTSFIGLYWGDEGLRSFCVRAEQIDTPSFGDVFRSGSGSAAIDDFSELIRGSTLRVTAAINPAQVAASYGLMLGGVLLNEEFRGGETASTIQNMFGGGYEIALFADGKIGKLPATTYIFWEANVGAEGVQFSSPQLVVKQRYSGDFLLICSARIEARDGRLQMVDEQRHIIRPMFESEAIPSKQDLAQESFYSPLMCHCVLVREGATARGWYTKVKQSSSQDAAGFMFEDQGHRVIFSFQAGALEELARAVEKFRSHPSP